MTLARVEGLARAHQLSVFGAFHPTPDDGLPEEAGTLILLGPHEPGFWPHVTAEPEFLDRRPDPIDRWSRRVIAGIAADLNGQAHFPFDGPPWPPFIAWAQQSGRAWASEVGILVHDRAGLMVSYRGAISVRQAYDLPAPPPRPCDSCESKPCLAACPTGALTADGYDVPACRTHIQTENGRDCMQGGCLVRRACPVSKSYGRLPQQSAYHMSRFQP